MAQTDFSQNAGGGSANNFNAASWANARAGIGGTTNYDDDLYTLRSDLSGRFIQRCFMVFDTSALTALATITAAEVQMYRNTSETFTNTDTCTIHLVTQNQSDPLELGTAGDYTTVDFNSRGSLLFSETSSNAYATIPLTDLTVISKTGYTKLAAITNRDLDNNQPTGGNLISFDAFGQSNPPFLRVTYTLPNNAGGAFLFNLVN